MVWAKQSGEMSEKKNWTVLIVQTPR